MYNQQNSSDNSQYKPGSQQSPGQWPTFRPRGQIKIQRHATQSTMRQLKSGAAPASADGAKSSSMNRALAMRKLGMGAKPPAPAAPAPKPSPSAVVAEQIKACIMTEMDNYVRRPLEGIAACVASLQAGIEDETERADTVETVAYALGVLSRNVDDILDLAGFKDESGKVDDTADIAAISEEVTGMFSAAAADKGLTISSNVCELPGIKMNPHKIRMILMALVDNAVKFTPSGRIGVYATFRNDILQITVEDTGYGISVPTLQQISDDSLSGNWKGDRPTGFAIVGRLVLDLGGEVAIRSTPGIGTVVQVTFANVKTDPNSSGRRMTSWQRIGTMRIRSPKRLSTAARIILVDKSPIHNAIMEGVVRSMGFMNTATLTSGTDALKQLMTGTVDVIFTDIDLPQMDGRTLISEIRKIPAFSEVRVYAVTADESITSDYATIGFDGVILKPITPAKLKVALE